MPELAEVEYARRLLMQTVVGRMFSMISVDPGSEKTLFKTNAKGSVDVCHAMLDRKLVDVRRKGKNLVLFTTGTSAMPSSVPGQDEDTKKDDMCTLFETHFHFGMKGLFSVDAKTPSDGSREQVKQIYYMTDKRKSWLPSDMQEKSGSSILGESGKVSKRKAKRNAVDSSTSASSSKTTETTFGPESSSDQIVPEKAEEGKSVRIPKNRYIQDNGDSEGAETQWPPKHWRMLFETDDPNVRLAFVDSRKFSKIAFLQEAVVMDQARLAETIDGMWSSMFPDLAVDPLTDLPDPETFQQLCQNPRIAKQRIKSILLDQHVIVCGIGNWLVDEILFDCRLHPQRTIGSLNSKDISSLRDSIDRIIDISCNHANADSHLFPKHWLFHVRWDARPGKVDASRPDLELLQIDGRTTVVDPKRQKEPEGVEIKRKPINNNSPSKSTSSKPDKSAKQAKSKVSRKAHAAPKRESRNGITMKVVRKSTSLTKGSQTLAKRKSAMKTAMRIAKPTAKKQNYKNTNTVMSSTKNARAMQQKRSTAKQPVMKHVRKKT